MRVLIDASNLHAGGGVQVAASFLDELGDPQMQAAYPWLREAVAWVSSEVAQNLANPDSRLVHSATGKHGRRKGFDLEFVVFGPVYRRRRGLRQVMGFADVNLVYSRPRVLGRRTARESIKWRARALLARRSFRRADVLVVETDAAKRRLVLNLGVRQNRIVVVPNTVSGAFIAGDGEPIEIPRPNDAHFIFCYITRPYPHKNFAFLGEVLELLRTEHRLVCKAIVTLSPAEWDGLAPITRKHLINLGPQSVSSIRQIYEAVDAAIFPSLLECFSASPLEALICGTPLLASDRDFVRTICGDVPVYFDPEDAASASSTICAALGDPAGMLRRGDEGRSLAAGMPTARMRANDYLRIMEEAMQGGRGC